MSRRCHRKCVRALWLCVVFFFGIRSLLAVDFEREIAPLITKRCVECHNSSPEKKGGLDLTTHASAMRGGESGAALTPGKPDESMLLQRVIDGEMPPLLKGKSQKLPDEEIKLLEQWIALGTGWPKERVLDLFDRTTDLRAGRDWWSLQPVKRSTPPKTNKKGFVANEIDSFVLANLEKQKMQPAPIADRRTLIRRVYFDLIGLPPTTEQADAFVKDKSPQAYENLIDKLLISKHYGERWGRYWLDLVRFAETCGYERDQLKPNIWKYRDWVIKALNDDMPYDRFVTEQLAGDEVSWRNEQSVIATGMLRAGTWNDEPNDPADYMFTRLEDMVHTTTSAFLGLTVKCARCHDHKFDPIRQTDYYRTASFFWAGYIGQANLGGPNKEELGYDVFGWTDKDSYASPINLLIKGERHRPGPVVEPGFLSAVVSLDKPLAIPPSHSKTTFRRLQFAAWIVDPKNPLTARVFVNRLWQHHFGQAIVRTPNNFGFKSDPPTHPKLLDWLASEFMEGGWKIKRMHKLIVMSSTYRQSSLHPKQEEYAERDFLNRNWWRQNRRRLDAEALRDSMLTVSGNLNAKVGGPSFYPKMSPEALEGLSRKASAWGTSSEAERRRRSVYMMTKRSRLLPLMTTFDFGDTTLPCGQRDVTIVAPQALALLNNHFVHGESDAFARRIAIEAGDDAQIQIEHAWRLALGRLPTAEETAAAKDHLKSQLEHFQSRLVGQIATDENSKADLDIKDKLVLWLRADRDVQKDDKGRVMLWRDRSPLSIDGLLPHDASQANAEARPLLVSSAIGKQPALRFNGKGHFMHLAGRVVWSQQFSVFAVVNHLATEGAAREIISNWHRRGRSTTSMFLGTAGHTGVRFTDAFAPAGNLAEPSKPFILTGISSNEGAFTFQNREPLATSGKLSQRDLQAPYVVGTQGNYGTEFWHGDIAEILVYDRAVDEAQREAVWKYLANRYGLSLSKKPTDPKYLALASLCHVLLNTNEFIYVD